MCVVGVLSGSSSILATGRGVGKSSSTSWALTIGGVRIRIESYETGLVDELSLPKYSTFCSFGLSGDATPRSANVPLMSVRFSLFVAKSGRERRCLCLRSPEAERRFVEVVGAGCTAVGLLNLRDINREFEERRWFDVSAVPFRMASK